MPDLPAQPTSSMTELSKKDPVRKPSVRSSRKTAVKLEANKSNLEAYMGQLCGEVVEDECKHCVKEGGPWTECVVVDGLFGGSCCNCHYNNSGNRCSLRKFLALFRALESGN